MKIEFAKTYRLSLLVQVLYIAKDKPLAARKFRKDIIRNIKKDLVNPFHFKKSIYYEEENIRDYVFKGYTSVYKIDIENQTITVFGFIKHKETL
ncbi:type II toxin-antitoxin system RelE/ParE family toxin [Flavobacterium sp.]|uniref:type II toxin-antitoxin system RelE/ParE family toxin n=1 Tax=Flavobacterium sp. TaxID=239 RepID=UPI00286DDCD9|nr:type II toxin-antitoxin system RelE/ParE family toxin [Flavobacterium sp.]